MMNTDEVMTFAPMGLEAVAMRIGNVCGHNLDATMECIEQKGMTAIRIAEQDASILTYAFVLNFFNSTECYADFNSFGITIRPNDGNCDRESDVMDLWDNCSALWTVRNSKMGPGTWQQAVRLYDPQWSTTCPIFNGDTMSTQR